MAPNDQRPTTTALSTLLTRDTGALKVRPLNAGRNPADYYHQLLRASWPQLFVWFCASFIAFNLVFAALYCLDPGGVDVGSRPIKGAPFWRAMVFSVDTMATVGYGNMVPVSIYANVVATIEIALGILFGALVTGIAFARFSRPTARILFSHVAVVWPIDGVPTLMFRAANQRHNLIFEVSATVSLLSDASVEGRTFRRFQDLTLVRSANPVFALTWTMMHPITPDSPLAGWLDNRCAQPDDEIIVVLSGTDDRTGQLIHGRWAYGPRDVHWGARFVDIIGLSRDGTRTIDYGRFHDFEPVMPS